MQNRNLPGPVLISLAIIAWAVVLWLFTIGYPGMKPVAHFIFTVLVLPNAIVEWLKIKNLLTNKVVLPTRLLIIAIFAVLWVIWRQV